jgi:hypothetical protein
MPRRPTFSFYSTPSTLLYQFTCVRIVAKIAYYFHHVLLLFVCPSLLMYQLISHWTNFHEILYWRPLWKSVRKPEIWFKSGKNIGPFTQRPKYLSLLPVTLIATKALSSIEIVSNSPDSRGGTNLTPTRHTDTLYVPFYLFKFTIGTTHAACLILTNNINKIPEETLSCPCNPPHPPLTPSLLYLGIISVTLFPSASIYVPRLYLGSNTNGKLVDKRWGTRSFLRMSLSLGIA